MNLTNAIQFLLTSLSPELSKDAKEPVLKKLTRINLKYPGLPFYLDSEEDTETSVEDAFEKELESHLEGIETYLKEKMRPFLSAT